jgi:hypothetical protein
MKGTQTDSLFTCLRQLWPQRTPQLRSTMYPFIVILGGICVFTLVKLLLAAHDSSRKANKLGQTPPCAPGRLPVFGHAFAMLYNPYRLVTSLEYVVPSAESTTSFFFFR